ncbi:Cupredoxin [Mycena crocata]|nr:Cupredoxin [Mycena crocata]
MLLPCVFYLLSLAAGPVFAAAHQVAWSIDYVLAVNPDGLFPRRVVGVNNKWPPPPIEMADTDELQITATNHLDLPVSLNVHGMTWSQDSSMTGVMAISQCGIPPGATFTYVVPVDTSGQSGTFWIHGFSAGYADGLRAPVIIQGTNEIYRSLYDLEATVNLGDWYHQEYASLLHEYINKNNPSGIIPHADSGLLYYSQNGAYLAPLNGTADTGSVGINENSTLLFVPGKRYRLRVVNLGATTTFYFWIDSHKMTVIEVDGIAVQQFQPAMLSVFVGQRYSIIIAATQQPGSKHAVHANMDPEGFPPGKAPNITSSITYLPQSPLPITNLGPVAAYTIIDDTSLAPAEPQAAPFVDVTLEFNASCALMSDGTNRALFNDFTYNRPLVPSLFSALSLADPGEASAYGPSTFVLAANAVYELTVNNFSGRMLPLYLHGHVVMLMSRTSAGSSPALSPSDNPCRRDVVVVPPGGSVTIRFTADNPGAWLFQGPNAFHLDAGLAVQFIEAVDLIPRTRVPEAAVDQCLSQGFPVSGNAAGHDNPDDFSGWSQGPFLLTSTTASATVSSTVFSSSTDSASASASSTIFTASTHSDSATASDSAFNTASDTFTADPPTATSPPASNDTQFEPEYSAVGASTFIFLTDPQQWRSDSGDERLDGCSALNVQLNTLDISGTWPTNFPISVPGQQIGAITAVVFGGDLCQTGGDYNPADQVFNLPPTYIGGSELMKLRSLYQPGFGNTFGVTLLKYGPKYFGLGNHDMQTEFHPGVGWSEGALHFSSPNNFWRYQMWNFVTQMHTGESALSVRNILAPTAYKVIPTQSRLSTPLHGRTSILILARGPSTGRIIH